MDIRAYRPQDCRQILKLFYHTVHSVNAADYSPEQLAVWATGEEDPAVWNASLTAHMTLVAVEGDLILGFGDMDVEAGYLDRLYVHKDYQGRGVATALCRRLEAAVPSGHITTHASITARPFFLARGYRVVRQQQVQRRGIWLTNFVMEKSCRPIDISLPVC